MVTTKVTLMECCLVSSFVFYTDLWPTSKNTVMEKMTKRGNTVYYLGAKTICKRQYKSSFTH